MVAGAQSRNAQQRQQPGGKLLAHALQRLVRAAPVKRLNPLRDGRPDDSLQPPFPDHLIKWANNAAQAGRGTDIGLGFVGVVGFEGGAAADLLKQVSDSWCGALWHA